MKGLGKMKKSIYIEFNPQDTNDTKSALAEAQKEVFKNNNKVILKPSTNLIYSESLALILHHSTLSFLYTSNNEFITD